MGGHNAHNVVTVCRDQEDIALLKSRLIKLVSVLVQENQVAADRLIFAHFHHFFTAKFPPSLLSCMKVCENNFLVVGGVEKLKVHINIHHGYHHITDLKPIYLLLSLHGVKTDHRSN